MGGIPNVVYKIRKLEFEEHKRDVNILWVSDLVRCPLKRLFELKYSEIVQAETFNPIFIIGDLIHKGIQNYLGLAKERSLLNYEVQVEVEGQKEVEVNGKKVTIRGRLDILIKNNSELIGYEIKYSKNDGNIPYEHHKLQILLYKWLFNLNKAYLLYITPERIVEFEINESLNDGDILKLVKDTLNLRKTPRYSWECGYCPYSVLCPYKKTS